MQLRALIKSCFLLNEQLSEEILEKDVTALTHDTRTIEKDTLFVAIKGAAFDGHQHLEEAIHKGALAVVVEKIPTNPNLPYFLVKDTRKALAQLACTFYQNPSQKLPLIGVTGTNGKTTTTHLIDSIAQYCQQQTALIGTLYNKIKTEIIPTINTTPDSLTLQQLFAQMVEKKVDVCSMEVSSHALQQGRTWGADFDVAVFTNLTQDHLDFHKNMNDYFLAKSLLFSQLGNSYPAKKKFAIVNCDDSYGRKLIPLTSADVFTYGVENNGDFTAHDIQLGKSSTQFTLSVFGEKYAIDTPLVGQFNVYNLLAAIAACYVSGYPLPDILNAVKKIRGVHGRFESVPNKKGITAVVDYAHTPDGLAKVLQTARELTDGKIYCVVGCGGDRDRTKRPLMGAIATEEADYVIFTSDNPRTEDPQLILADITEPLEKNNYQVAVDRYEAIQIALNLATTEDIVLVAGKGHEDYQIIGTKKNHFDDFEVIQEILGTVVEGGK